VLYTFVAYNSSDNTMSKIDQPKIPINIKPMVRLTKISESNNPLYPGNIADGHIEEGEFIAAPKVGESFWVGLGWRTSTVQEILPDNKFRTHNSIYKFEIF